ncbi:uncharacterized protein [Oscarella lobularis]|uniref:uncharacterized protein n=1 Tax=Oscarella lobularis TaxID=121494 RepID=UPI003313EFD3
MTSTEVGFVETVSRSQSFSELSGIVVLDEGVFCTDYDKHCIWKVDPSSGTASCFAGVEGNAGFPDGSSTTAKFYGPNGLAVSASKSSIYVTDFDTGRIRKVQLGDGAVSTVLGDCRFPEPGGIVATDDGRLLLSCGDCTIREIRVDTEPASTSVAAGTSGEAGDRDGHGNEAKFDSPDELVVGPDGSVYVADFNNSAIRTISRDYEVGTIGTGFKKTVGVAVDDEGNVYVSDRSHKIYVLAPSGMKIVCGSGERNSVDGSGALASLKEPRSLFYDSKSGFLYFTESNAVRRVRVKASTFRDPKLSIDLAKMMNGSDSLPAGDTIFLVEGKRISVCTNLLCVRSEYFSSMFSSNWKEYSKKDTSESTPICIEDATYESFDAVITFLVTGCLEILKHSHIIPDILVLADRYLVESLREFCIAHLVRRVSNETAVDYLSLADRFGFRELKKVALQFVAKNFKTLCRDDNFAGLGSSELLVEIVRAIASSS